MPIQNKQGRIFLTLTEIAIRWGISVTSVMRSHIGTKRLPTIRAGKSHLVCIDDLIAYESDLKTAIKQRILIDQVRLKRLEAPVIPKKEADAI